MSRAQRIRDLVVGSVVYGVMLAIIILTVLAVLLVAAGLLWAVWQGVRPR